MDFRLRPEASAFAKAGATADKPARRAPSALGGFGAAGQGGAVSFELKAGVVMAWVSFFVLEFTWVTWTSAVQVKKYFAQLYRYLGADELATAALRA